MGPPISHSQPSRRISGMGSKTHIGHPSHVVTLVMSSDQQSTHLIIHHPQPSPSTDPAGRPTHAACGVGQGWQRLGRSMGSRTKKKKPTWNQWGNCQLLPGRASDIWRTG